MSLLDYVGLPGEFGLTILLLSLVIFVAPFLAGSDFGFLKVPAFSEKATRRMYFIGPAMMVAAVSIHIPILEDTKAPTIQLPLEQTFQNEVGPNQFITTVVKISADGALSVTSRFSNGSRLDGETFEAGIIFLDDSGSPIAATQQRHGVNAAGGGAVNVQFRTIEDTLPPDLLAKLSNIQPALSLGDASFNGPLAGLPVQNDALTIFQ